MNEVLIFPDTVSAVVGYLRVELAARGETAQVGTRIPAPRPVEFVRVERTGGTRNTDEGVPLESCQLTIESWAAAEEQAADLAQLCRALIHAASGRPLPGVQFYRVVEIAGPGNLPDPVSDQPRYSFTVLVTVRAAAE